MKDYACRGNATPDHSIRIKRFGLVLPAPNAEDIDGFKAAAAQAVADFADNYAQYFEPNNARLGESLTMLDPVPRVAYVPSLGLFWNWTFCQGCRVCADIAEATVNCIANAERLGADGSPCPEEDIFDVEVLVT